MVVRWRVTESGLWVAWVLQLLLGMELHNWRWYWQTVWLVRCLWAWSWIYWRLWGLQL